MTKSLFFPFLSLLIFSSTLLAEPWFIDKTYVYQEGSKLSEQYLNKTAPDFKQQHQAILPWIVRVEVKMNITATSYSSNHGTGIILKDGIVMTAKHVLMQNSKDPKKNQITLTMTDGRTFPAKLMKTGKKDWVALKMVLTAEQKEMLNSPIKVAKPVLKETCVFFGYPAQLGLDQEGKVQSFHKGDKKQNIPVSQLNPMIVVAVPSDLKVMHLKPLAGFPAVGGMSGGPIFNLKGEFVAVQHSIATTRENATGKVLNYRVDATSIVDIAFPISE